MNLHKSGSYDESLGRFLVRSVVGTGAVRVTAMLASFAVGVQLARGLGVRDYGFYGLALSVISTAGLPAEMGLPTLATREVAIAASRGEFGLLLGVVQWGRRVAARLSIGIVFAIIVAAVVIGEIRPSPLVIALVAGSVAIPFRALARVNGGALQGLHYIVRGQIPINLFAPVFMSIALLGFYLAGLDLRPASAMALYSFTSAGAWLLTEGWLKPRLPKGKAAVSAKEGARWVSSVIPLALTDGMFALQFQISMILLGIVTSASDLGLFRISIATATVLSAPQAIMLGATLPLLSRLYEERDKERLQKLLTKAAQAQSGGVLLLTIPLLIEPEKIIVTIFGEDYSAAGNLLRIMLVGQLVNAAFGLNAQVLNMTHHEKRVTRAMAVSLALNVGALPLFVAGWGLIGAGIAYLISMMAWNLITWLDARSLLGVDTSFLPVHLLQKH